MAARGELGRHRGVHGDHDLLFVGHECISFLDLLMDPGLEVLPEDSRADINYPLLGHLAQVWLVREVHVDAALAAHVSEDFLKGETLVLRHVQRLHLVHREVGLLATKDIFQEVDRDIVWKK